VDSPDLTGYLCEQCLDAPAVAFVAAPWGGERGMCVPWWGAGARRALSGCWCGLGLPPLHPAARPGRGCPRLPPALCGHRPPGAGARVLAGQRTPDHAPRRVPAVLWAL